MIIQIFFIFFAGLVLGALIALLALWLIRFVLVYTVESWRYIRELFAPNIDIRGRITTIPVETLRGLDIRTLLIDLNGTITEPGGWPDNKFVSWLTKMESAGIRCCIVSNNPKRRVHKIAEWLEIPAVSGALKPLGIGIYKAMDLLDALPEDTAIVGDCIYTDIFAGKRLGIAAILVSRKQRPRRKRKPAQKTTCSEAKA